MACQYARRSSTLFNHPSCDPTHQYDKYLEYGDLGLDVIPQAQHPHHHPGKRPRHHPQINISIDNHEENETMALKYIALLAKWVRGLREAHRNCLNIPVSLVIKMGVRMIHYLVLKRGLKMKTETLAATFWVALKFYSSRDTIPNASFMSMVTDVSKQALLDIEPDILAHLGWDLYAFYRDE